MMRPVDWLFRRQRRDLSPDNVLDLRPTPPATPMDKAAGVFSWTAIAILLALYHAIFVILGMWIGPVWI